MTCPDSVVAGEMFLRNRNVPFRVFQKLHIASAVCRISETIGISAAALSEIMRGVNNPNAEVVLHVQEILDKSMSTQIAFNPAKVRTPAHDDDPDDQLDFLNDDPKTLGTARSMLTSARKLIAKLEQAQSAAATGTPTLPIGSKQPTSATDTRKPGALATSPAKPAAPSPATSTKTTDMVIRCEKPVTELDQLRAELNATKDDGQRVILYKRIKEGERANSLGPNPTARFRGL
jgi:transcriptional regulator with XRE-family HTH domain